MTSSATCCTAALGWSRCTSSSAGGLTFLDQRIVTVLLLGAFALLILVMLPGFGVQINGARRWFAPGRSSSSRRR